MNKTHLRNIILIILLSIAASWQLFRPGYFTMHDDLQVMRVYEMDRCLKDGQIPCRWSPDMGAGYGQPMYNFYSAFPYYLGGLIKTLGFGFIVTVKALILICLIASGVFAYYLFAQLFLPLSALVGALAYVFVPYRALDLFVRGALSESFALALLPLVAAGIISVIKDPKPTKTALLALSVGALFSTHNITTMISAPLFIILTILFLYTHKFSVEKIIHLSMGALLGFGLSAFFLLPVIFEKGLAHTEFLISDYYNFQNHFISLKQIFLDLRWGFGSENIGPGGQISFFIGFLPIAALVILPLILLSKKLTGKRLEYLTIWVLAMGVLLMTHSKSFYIWNAIPSLAYVQFPWRFLGIFALFTSWILAAISENYNKYRWLSIATIILLVALNFGYFRFGRLLPEMTDSIKLSGGEFANQSKAALLDYLPKSSTAIPQEIAPDSPQILTGRVSINYFDKRTAYFSSEFDIYTDSATIQFPVVYFPGWELHQNRSPEVMKFEYDNDLGLITVELTAGHHLVQGFFENTPIRTVGNLLTFISALGLLTWCIFTYEKNKQ